MKRIDLLVCVQVAIYYFVLVFSDRQNADS